MEATSYISVHSIHAVYVFRTCVNPLFETITLQQVCVCIWMVLDTFDVIMHYIIGKSQQYA